MGKKLFIGLLDDSQRQAIKDAGHDLAHFPASEADKLVALTKAHFPDLVAAIEKGIKDANSANTKGVLKLEAVAMDAVAAFPAVLKAIPEAKSFAIQLVQSVFNDGLTELEHVAASLIAKL